MRESEIIYIGLCPLFLTNKINIQITVLKIDELYRKFFVLKKVWLEPPKSLYVRRNIIYNTTKETINLWGGGGYKAEHWVPKKTEDAFSGYLSNIQYFGIRLALNY